MKGYMVVDGQKVEYNDEKNVLDVVRNAGVDLPTFCYHSELSIYGACRMCMVEDKWGGTFASCSTPPKSGMEVYTNTPKLQKHRRMILELLLSNHCRDCTVCEKNGKCKLQELAVRFGIKKIRFNNIDNHHPLDESSTSITRNPNKCILCGDCVRMCEEVQGVGVLGFAYRGSKIKVTPAFNKQLSEADCVNCGQCTVVCPTGALIVKNETDKAWSVLNNPQKRVVVQIAPAVRVAIGEEFGLPAGEIVTGKLVAALRKLGFDEVYDTAIAADLTVMEETKEFMNKLKKGDNALPLFTSCCPAWVRFAEQKYPQLQQYISSCRSPQQMFGAVIKEHYRSMKEIDSRETVVVSIMPCTAKKYEASRPELSVNGEQDVDIVLTTQELALMLKEAGIIFNQLEGESLDMPFGLASGAGVIFGVTGGVAEAVLRRCYTEKTAKNLKEIEFVGTRGMQGVKEAVVEIDEKQIKIAVVHGLKNAQELVEQIQAGEKQYDFVEVMACPGGCIGGAGQPLPVDSSVKQKRAKGIYKADRTSQIKRSEENPMVVALYNGMLKDKHHLLHR
ncbi:2Fe-2S iron-sulfur cluster binding domain-containing protein [Petroclostridium sp. X23]|uniref:2Fe-2S iron-sulfur cluster binding domain-containing protein n=1 Tax=Petroclostridium sp. X23 TaxID=3045146 RepID=UPI0024ADC6E8|nr:2Fe-2S iron-sulfur cluster binding domain-containing protein [Petroclostridium sp. X23]WHH57346.1 [FeFe] hydrogenase, group A [Petroclostridium sp. X23]